MSFEKTFVKYSTYLSHDQAEKLRQISKRTDIPISQIIAFAVAKEFRQSDAFEFPHEIPSEAFERFAYAAEASKVLDFFKKYETNFSLMQLINFRDEIGIEDVELLMYGIKECENEGHIIRRKLPNYQNKGPQGYFFYTLNDREEKKLIKDFAKYTRLKKKFEKDKEL